MLKNYKNTIKFAQVKKIHLFCIRYFLDKRNDFMDYKQFQNAAYRHLVSCKQLLSDAKDSRTKKDTKDRLCLEIYYLGGYILETMLSYAVCSSMNISGDVYQSKPFKEDANLFKVHNLNQKYHYALQKGCNGLRNICFFKNKHPNVIIQNLFSDWHVKYRYENKANLSLNDLSVFIESIENIYQTILQNYTR